MTPARSPLSHCRKRRIQINKLPKSFLARTRLQKLMAEAAENTNSHQIAMQRTS